MRAKRTTLLVVFVLMVLAPTGCASRLTQAQAIAKVLQVMPAFPAEPGKTYSVETPIGGPFEHKARVNLTTTVEPSGTNSFVVTLTRNWNLTVNGTPVVSTWKYKVDKGSVTLLESHDLDIMVTIIK